MLGKPKQFMDRFKKQPKYAQGTEAAIYWKEQAELGKAAEEAYNSYKPLYEQANDSHMMSIGSEKE